LTHREYIRKILRKHKSEGLAPFEMRRLAKQEGRGVAASFPYEQLKTLKRDGEVAQNEQGSYLLTSTQAAR